ncbi:MAG TPA: tetratricopeptide repeat protein [Pyrinomonadaceae bacterium]
MKRIGLVMVLFLLVLCAGIGMRVWNWYSQPFNLKQYLDYIDKRGLYVIPPEKILKFAEEQSLLINVPAASDKNDLRRRVFVIDTERLINDWRTPTNFREFTESNIYESGAAYACQQLFIVDGSILARHPSAFTSRMTGISAEYLSKNGADLTVEEAFSFTFFHEFAHIIDFHFSLGETEQKAFDKALKLGNTALENNKWDDAVSRFQEAIEICPADYRTIDWQAVAENRRGNFDRAIELYRRSLTINSKDQISRDNLVLTLVSANRREEAFQQIEANEQANPNDPENVFWSGVLLYQSGNINNSYNAFSKARERYLSAKDERVIHANLLRYALVSEYESINVKPRFIYEQNVNDCKIIPQTSELAKGFCKTKESDFSIYAKKGLSEFPQK